MTKDMKLEFLLEHLEEEAGYLASLCEGARKALDDNPEYKDDGGNGYPFLYGYVASGVNHHSGEINKIVKDLKELLYN